MDASDKNEDDDLISSEELSAALFDGYICSVARAARALGLTVQRLNQLAKEGVIVKLGRGVCNFTESLHRYTAYRIEAMQNARQGRPSIVRDPDYWAMRSRQLQLAEGATRGELTQLRRAVASLCESFDTYDWSKAELSQEQARHISEFRRELLSAASPLLYLFKEIDDRALVHAEHRQRYKC